MLDRCRANTLAKHRTTLLIYTFDQQLDHERTNNADLVGLTSGQHMHTDWQIAFNTEMKVIIKCRKNKKVRFYF